MKIIAVIPARYESTRLPAKVLAKDTGKFLIQHTYEQVARAESVDEIIIAADNVKIQRACESFGAKCIMTSTSHQSGTDRIAEAAADIKADIVVNVQADEPEIEPANINLLVNLLAENPSADMATLIAKFEDKDQIANPNIVKVIASKDNFAMYFSRSVIPYDRGENGIGDIDHYRRHLGIYAYRKDFLTTITELPQTKLEKLEKLEQLRVLEYGFKILTGLVGKCADGIDTPEQYKEFVLRQNSK